jgi:hypothetical protein
MRRFVIAGVLCFLVWPASAWAQTTASATQRGTTKLWIGAGLLAAGAIVMPITEPSHEHARLGTGLGLMSAGGAMVLWGAQQRRRSPRPQTRVTFVANKHVSIVLIGRTW